MRTFNFHSYGSLIFFLLWTLDFRFGFCFKIYLSLTKTFKVINSSWFSFLCQVTCLVFFNVWIALMDSRFPFFFFWFITCFMNGYFYHVWLANYSSTWLNLKSCDEKQIWRRISRLSFIKYCFVILFMYVLGPSHLGA